MPQHDYNIANDSGANTRGDFNNAFAAIVQNNSGATEPSTMFAHMLWADTSPSGYSIIKVRNAANAVWATCFDDEGRWKGIDGSASEPSMSFGSDVDTGLYLQSSGELAVTIAGARQFLFEAGKISILSPTGEAKFVLNDTTASTNETIWSIESDDGNFELSAWNDIESARNIALSVTRSAAIVGMFAFSGTGITMTGAFIRTPVTITTDTTPTAVGRAVIIIGTWVAGNNITDFDNETAGQVLRIHGGDADCNIVDGAPIQLVGNTTWNAAAGATIELLSIGGVWYEQWRSDAS